MSNKRPIKTAKVLFRDGNNKQHVVIMPVISAEDGHFIVQHPDDKSRSFTLLEADSFYTKKKLFQFTQPPWVRTWLVREGINGSIGLHKGKIVAAGLTDVQQNTMLHTKVIQEFLMADLLSQVVGQLKTLMLIAIIVMVVVALGVVYDITLDTSTKNFVENLVPAGS